MRRGRDCRVHLRHPESPIYRRPFPERPKVSLQQVSVLREEVGGIHLSVPFDLVHQILVLFHRHPFHLEVIT